MKKLLTVAAIAAFALTFGVAFADEMPGTRAKDAGAYYGVASPKHDAEFGKEGVKGAAPGGLRADEGKTGFSIIDILSPTGVRREVGGEGKTLLDE